MIKDALKKLKNRKGSTLPEAMIGFLMVTITSMILVGTVSTSSTIMQNSDQTLNGIYQEQQVFDVFLHHGYTDLGAYADPAEGTFRRTASVQLGQDSADLVNSLVALNCEQTDPNGLTTITLYDGATPHATFNVSYCRAREHDILCFSTVPGNQIR